MVDELKYSKSLSAGFTLLEAIVAISLLIGGALVLYASSAQLMAYTYNNQYRLTASYLAQEAAEIVRNIRDQNWIDNADWRLNLQEGTWQVQHNSTSLDPYTGARLQLSDGGLYNYGVGDNTIFIRKVTIDYPSPNSIKATVEVSWPYDGSNPVVVENFLYNWF
jgi:hypothetical protein